MPLSSIPNTSLILHGTILDFSAAQGVAATSAATIKVAKLCLRFWLREDWIEAK